MEHWKLEIEKYKGTIEKSVANNAVTIIRGPTGCGKTTYVPLMFQNKNVAIVEPRRLAVLHLYNILKTKINNLGYRMRFNRRAVDMERKRTVIYTDGAFLFDLDLTYDIIIVDEIHERSTRMDILLMLLKQKFKNKLILMSATLDINVIQTFFNANLVDIKCKSFHCEEIYLETPTNDYIFEAFATVKTIIKTDSNDSRKDILIFLPGVEDINDLFKLIRRLPNVTPYKIFSTIDESEQLKIFENTPLRKVILATNICETSLTIPSVKYVIDTGLVKNKIFNKVSYFGIQSISCESAEQRKGRANRLGEGVCYRLYTKSQPLYNKIADILTSDITTSMLILLKYNLDILEVEFLEYPPYENITFALQFLLDKHCIVIVNNRFKITSYGKRLLTYPFDVHLSNLYESTLVSNLGYFGNILVALISLDNYNFMQYSLKKEDTDIDYLLNIFENYLKAHNKKEYCDTFSLPDKGMDKAFQIFKTLKKTHPNNLNAKDEIHKIFSKCFEHNLCIRQKDGSYKIKKTNQVVYLHPSSPFFKRNIQKIVVVDFFYTTKCYCRIVGKYFISI